MPRRRCSSAWCWPATSARRADRVVTSTDARIARDAPVPRQPLGWPLCLGPAGCRGSLPTPASAHPSAQPQRPRPAARARWCPATSGIPAGPSGRCPTTGPSATRWASMPTRRTTSGSSTGRGRRRTTIPARYTYGVTPEGQLLRDDDQPPGYRLQVEDTSYPVERMLVQAWRAMTPAEKVRQLVECCRAVDQLVFAGLRLRYPLADDGMLRRHAAKTRLGPELARAVYGSDPLD